MVVSVIWDLGGIVQLGRDRLIGIDISDTKHLGNPVQHFRKEASIFAVNIVEGKKVRLEFDQNQRDKYKRLLAYVYLEDGTFLNAAIIKRGYGHAYIKHPFRCMNEFRQYEKEASIRKRGLWK